MASVVSSDESRAVSTFYSAFADAKEKITKRNFPCRDRVAHLRDEIRRHKFLREIFTAATGVLRAAHGSKAGRQPDDVVAVTVPDAQRIGNSAKSSMVIGAMILRTALPYHGGRPLYYRPGDG